MDVLDFVRVRYAEVHGRVVSDLLERLTEPELRRRPHPGVNTIAWLVWHSARIEDVGMNRFVGDRPQVLEDGWLERLRTPRRDVGTGMNDADVDALSASIDLPALRGYWDAVTHRTLDLLAGDLRRVDLEVTVSAERVEQVAFGEGAVAREAAWLAKFWAGAGPEHGCSRRLPSCTSTHTTSRRASPPASGGTRAPDGRLPARLAKPSSASERAIQIPLLDALRHVETEVGTSRWRRSGALDRSLLSLDRRLGLLGVPFHHVRRGRRWLDDGKLTERATRELH